MLVWVCTLNISSCLSMWVLTATFSCLISYRVFGARGMGSASTTGLVLYTIAISVTGGRGVSFVSASAWEVRVSGKPVSEKGRAFGGDLGVNISTWGFMTSYNLLWNLLWESV